MGDSLIFFVGRLPTAWGSILALLAEPLGVQVRMLYVGRLQTAHGTRVTHRRDARLEAGRVQ